MPKPRKPSVLQPLKTLRIFCEGEKTEPNYLNGYISRIVKNGDSSVIKVEKSHKNTAIQLVDEAIKCKKSPSSLEGDEFWVLYDREAVSKYTDANHAAAYDRASKCGINVAICNVCFEYWILLHFFDTAAPYQNYEDLRRSSGLNESFQKLTGKEYDKSAAGLFDALRDMVPVARIRGSKVNRIGMEGASAERSRPYQINPYVGIVDLLDSIDKFK